MVTLLDNPERRGGYRRGGVDAESPKPVSLRNPVQNWKLNHRLAGAAMPKTTRSQPVQRKAAEIRMQEIL